MAVNGSEPVRAETLDRFAEAFSRYGFRAEALRPCYGLAECTLTVTMGGPLTPFVARDYDRVSLAEGFARRSASGPAAVQLVGCGAATRRTTLLVVDPESATPLPAGAVGEIWVQSLSNGLGYWGRGPESQETFQAIPDGWIGGGTFVRTGDLGFLDEEELFVTGRRKDVLIIAGENYYPQDAEALAKSSHRAFATQVCAAWSLDDGPDAQIAVVMETDERAETVLAEATRAAGVAVGSVLPARVTAIAVARNQIPRTTSGKIRRRECAEQAANSELDVLFRWPIR